MTVPARVNTLPSEGPAPKRAQGIGREMAKGSGWTIAARLGVQGIGILSTIVLARLLVPTDFGLVALASAFSAALSVISDFSFDVVLIHNQSATRAHYDTAWTLSICRNVIMTLCLITGAGTIASALGDPRIEGITYCLAVTTLIDGFQNIGIIDFRKDLTFHKDLIFMVLTKLVAFVVTIPLAILWRNYWALIAGIIASTIARIGLSYLMHSFRPRISYAAWREIMHFSKWLLLNNIFAFVFSRSDTFVIGKLIGPQSVGIYTVAYDIASLVTSNLLAPLRRAIFPGYAKVADESESLKKAFLGVLGFVLLIGAPMTLGVGLVAEPLVHVILGSQWLDSVPIIQVLSFGGLLSLVVGGGSPIFLAVGRPQYVMWVQGGSTIVLIPALIIGVLHDGVLGAAWAVLATWTLAASTDCVLLVRLLRLSLGPIAAACWRPLVAAAIMTIAVRLLSFLWQTRDSSVAAWSELLAAMVAVGGITYTAAVMALWLMSGRPDGAERHILTVVRQASAPLRRRLTS